jgi:hypothetical protein
MITRQVSVARTNLQGEREQTHVSSPTLYGRDKDTALIVGPIDRVRDEGGVLAFTGEAWIGYTRLLDVVTRIDRERGKRVAHLCGATTEGLVSPSALCVHQQALDPALNQVDVDKVSVLQPSTLQAAFGLTGDGAAPDIFVVGLAVLTLLPASVVRNPILIMTNDRHNLDQPTHAVLAFISGRS